uniref:Stearoyl-CoA desaturase 5 n=1 Tax=Astyanax mexicanus TaxID=7994 RepID=A0A3B1K8M5_ASTMX
MVAFPKSELRAAAGGRCEPEGAESRETEAECGDAKEEKRGQTIVWRNVVLMALLHLAAVYALQLIPRAHPFTWIWSYVCFLITGLGITAGAHRLWSHRSYKAKFPLRMFLAAANSMAFQVYALFKGILGTHNVKYSHTFDASPLASNELYIWDNPLLFKLLYLCAVLFRYYKLSVVMMCFVVPTLVPWYFWDESIWNSYFLPGILRYTICLNCTWLVNSAAHIYGNRPYDKYINPRENCLVTFGAMGEGFHNFHHTFPFDYSASEFGLRLNPTTCFIDFMCLLGLASNRKKATPEMIKSRKLRTGDGSA